LNVGIVVTELLDGRFAPWEKSLEWESYLDLYCLSLNRKGHVCVKYVPSIGVSRTQTYFHKFGHKVKRVPAYSKMLAPKALLRPRTYAGGHTTILGQFLGPSFTINLMKEARIDKTQVLHYSSYYTSFFVPAIIAAQRIPIVTQYTGGMLPTNASGRLFWKILLLPSLKSSRAVLLGDYESEAKTLVHDLHVPKMKQEFFNAPIVDSSLFHRLDKQEAQRSLGFDERKKNILCVTYIPPRPSSPVLLAKDPYAMIDVIERAVSAGGDEIAVYVAGWGRGADEFEGYVRDRGLTGRVHILGQVDHSKLPLYYSASDLLFVPFRLEKLNEGSATIEAFACGRPVTAFKRDSSNLTEQAGGFLLDGNSELGASMLLDRLRRPAYLEEKGREGNRVASQYTLDFASKRLEEIYAKVITNGRHRSPSSGELFSSASR
jgi:glycosyltransferase involved in cell wall biosynthesis